MQRLLFHLWYYRAPPWDTGISPPELLGYLAEHPPGRALDLGCGTGTNVITLAEHGWQVTGVDFAWRAIRIARRKARQAGIKADLRVGDVTRLKGIHGPFDLVLDIGCFHSLSEAGQKAYADQVTKLLASQGMYLLYAFVKTSASESRGIQESTLGLFSPGLVLTNRKDGLERESRPSAWFTFVKPGNLQG